MPKFATVDQSAPNKPPRLTPGELTPEVARDWDNACQTYFLHKDIQATNQVKMISFGMQDTRLHAWYLSQRDTLNAGSFEDYMKALKKNWLESNWEVKLRKKVLGSQQGTRSFFEWALDLQNQNSLLYGSTAHLSDIQLRNQLEANMADDLTPSVLRAKLADDLSMKSWIEEVKHLDDKRLEDMALHRKMAEELYKTNKRFTPLTNVSNVTNKPNSRPHPSGPLLPPLTSQERELLRLNNGCFKCRKFGVDHRAPDCPNGAPDATSYKTLTESDAAKVTKPKKPTAVVMPVAAVMPSSVLEGDSDSDE
ncbi:hypothetical protein DEU56DRAFT_733934, partial [Suillus clintonianus]|uniref:uncharacterized protein n=1 Tax=Suillus clintonianus TaxID=1904413 RepID=UPI001B86B420